MTRIVIMMAAVALVGCGNERSQYPAVAIASDVADPGEYREKRETRIEVPGAVPRVEVRLDTHCLKGGDDPVRSEVSERFAELCEGAALRFADGRIEGELNCRHSSGAPEIAPVRVSGTYARDRVELVTDSHVQGASIRQIRSFERIGDCDTVADAIARGDWSVADNREAAAQ